MFEAPDSPYLVPFDGSFRVDDASTSPATDGHGHTGKHRKHARRDLNRLQRVLAAGDRHAVLLVFQAMDAAGKDGTIRAVMQGVDPSGCLEGEIESPIIDLHAGSILRGRASIAGVRGRGSSASN